MKVSVLGGGSFGTALASVLCSTPLDVLLYSRSFADVDEINNHRRNSRYLGSRLLNSRLFASNRLSDMSESDILIVAVPSSQVQSLMESILPDWLGKARCIVNSSKGFALDGSTIYDYLRVKFPCQHVGSLKGPTFAFSLLDADINGFTLAFDQAQVLEMVVPNLSAPNVAVDTWHSPRDVEIVSAVKNILAVLQGLADSLGFSSNARYAILTKLFRLARLILIELGCDEGVLFAYAGVGDILLTSLENESRNRTLGLILGKGFDLRSLQSSPVTEGVRSVSILRQMLAANGVKIRVLDDLSGLISGVTALPKLKLTLLSDFA